MGVVSFTKGERPSATMLRPGATGDAVMLRPDQIEFAAGSLVRQRLSSAPVDLAEDMRPADEFEAYAVQAEVNRRLSQSGLGLPVGHKIAGGSQDRLHDAGDASP